MGPCRFPFGTGCRKRRGALSGAEPLERGAPTVASSAGIAALYHNFCGHDRASATAYLNDDIVVCVLADILTTYGARLVKLGSSQHGLDGRVNFQTDTQDWFTAVVETLTCERLVALLSANQTTPGCACELFFLEAAQGPSDLAVVE